MPLEIKKVLLIGVHKAILQMGLLTEAIEKLTAQVIGVKN